MPALKAKDLLKQEFFLFYKGFSSLLDLGRSMSASENRSSKVYYPDLCGRSSNNTSKLNCSTLRH